MAKKLKDEIIYFPFASEVPFHLRGRNYIIPKMDADNWNKIFKDKRIVLCLDGGFIENLFTLSYFEVLRYFIKDPKLEWCGSEFYGDISRIYGSSISDFKISKDILKKYPTPIFFNSKKDVVFINCLNNYMKVNNYFGDFRYNDHKAIFKQLFRNIMVDWNERFIFNLNKLSISKDLFKLKSNMKFDLDKPYILLIPDIVGWSNHEVSCLNWSVQEVKSFAAMLNHTKYNLIILTPFSYKYNGVKALLPKCTIENVLFLLKKSTILLSKEIDFNLASLLVSNNIIFSLKTFKEFNIEKNKKYIDAKNVILTSDKWTPFEVYEKIYEKNDINDVR